MISQPLKKFVSRLPLLGFCFLAILYSASTSFAQAQVQPGEIQGQLPDNAQPTEVEAERYTEDAREQLLKGQFQTVVDLTTKVIACCARPAVLADAYALRAHACTELQKYDEAIADGLAATKLAPTDGNAFFVLGRAYQMKGVPKRALETYTCAIFNDPTSARAYSNRALAYEDLNQYVFAKEDFSRAIELDPRFDFAFASRAEVNFVLKDYEACIRDANRAIELNPDNAFAYAQLACAFGLQNKKQQALEAAQNCVKIESRDNFLRTLGSALLDNGRVTEAIEQFSKSIAAAANVDAYEGRAICYCRLGNYESALKDYAEALKLKPNDGHFLGERALVLWLAGRQVEAQEAARVAVKALLRCAHSYSALVIEDKNSELPAVACADYIERALKLSDGQEDGRLYLLLADVHKRMGKSEQVSADIEKAESLGFKP